MKPSEWIEQNKWAKLDIMCTHCHGKAEIINEIIGIKLCNKCYAKLFLGLD